LPCPAATINDYSPFLGIHEAVKTKPRTINNNLVNIAKNRENEKKPTSSLIKEVVKTGTKL